MESPTEWVRGQTIGHGSFAIVSLAKPTSQSSSFPPLMVVKSCGVSQFDSLMKELKVIKDLAAMEKKKYVEDKGEKWLLYEHIISANQTLPFSTMKVLVFNHEKTWKLGFHGGIDIHVPDNRLWKKLRDGEQAGAGEESEACSRAWPAT
ncbi:hypothetical protein L1887_40701 [Cichorium endivia]|nr:hypothetical protein L1887_40701 [Cichorium endivia]